MERSGSEKVQDKEYNPGSGNLTEGRPDYIRSIFSRLAKRYDAGNALVSFGTHRYYKRIAIKNLALEPDFTVIDLCTGTGDMAFLAARRVNPAGIFGIDFSPEMIEIARTRAETNRVPVNFLVGDVTRLDFEDEMFDRAVMSFGLRNIPDKQRAFAETYRVLKPQGRFVVLEFSHPSDTFFPAGYRFYLHRLVPVLGWAASGDFQAYRYLVDSIEEFPKRRQIEALARDTGFKAESKGLLAGMLTLYNFVKA